MTKIKVMIIDDSSIIRSLLREVLSADSEIEIVAQAVNGRLALPRVKYYNPDVIILDYEMPEMNGIETLQHITEIDKSIRVIMFSSHTSQGAAVTLDALSKGASDFLMKPEFAVSDDPRVYLKEKLLPKIKALVHKHVYKEPKKSEAPAQKPKPAVQGSYKLCGIGISTGGPQALKKLLPLIPGDIDGSILVTIHMPPVFTQQLAEKLDSESALHIVEAEEGMKIEKGTVYIAPGGIHLTIRHDIHGNRVHLVDTEPVNHCKPSVDVMFESMLKVNPRQTVTVIMTGMGSDGFASMQELFTAGAYQIAQSREECLVYGMPSKPAESGIVHESLTIEKIAERITELLGRRKSNNGD